MEKSPVPSEFICVKTTVSEYLPMKCLEHRLRNHPTIALLFKDTYFPTLIQDDDYIFRLILAV